MYRKPRARLSRWLAPLCFGAAFVGLTVAACSVPEFEFPAPPAQGTAGDGSVVGNPPDPCENKQLDADSGETDFDCGGACAPCGVGQHCVDAPDCQPELLCHEGTCIGLGCMNGAPDGSETDEDCGGDSCMPCITGQGCALPRDCESGVCGDAKCLAPACDDQVSNGKETGLDCGGDCSPCPADQPCLLGKDCISGECNDEICGAECQDGFANCDKQNDNACEINTRTDLENCGFCGNACDLPNANAECSAGECRIKTDGCAVGFMDCNGLPDDGCEVDLKSNKLNCGACNKVCPDLNGTPSCEAGLCQIACNDGFKDCDDTRDNGCEINTKTNSKNCSACDIKCAAAAGYSAYCKDSTCGQTLCAAGKGDCNGDPVDACETTTSNDVDNCGGCGIKCEAVNATVDCVASKCVITGCKASYADCTGGYADGCETNTDSSTGHCGGCGKACNISNGTPKCDGGSCEVNSCSGTFRDCDGDPKTGCEVNVANNAKNCGGCGNLGSDCSTKYANASSTCSSSACTAAVCNSGFGDCDTSRVNGCESDTKIDAANCGGCGMACSTGGSAHVSSNDCVNSQCTPMCSGSYLTCDNNKFNGCEADKTSDESNCGACGTVCNNGATYHTSSNDCTGSTCHPSCTGTFGDCDSSRTNGCEVDTASSSSNCGACGNICDTSAGAHVTTNACSGSNCQPKCNGLFGDCDSTPENGCETPTSGDSNNCGACGTVCGTQNASGTSCASGKCNPTCTGKYAKCTNLELGCTTLLGTTSDCTKCGEACTSPTKFCDPGGCVDHRDIVVVNKETPANVGVTNGSHAVAGWYGNTSEVAQITLSHPLATDRTTNGIDNNRMILVGVACTDNYTAMEAITVTYGGTPMISAVKQLDSAGTHSFAGVYYLLDAALPASAGAKTVVASFGPGFTWGHAGIDVVELKNTMQVAPIATGGSGGGTACSSGPTRSVTVSLSQTGSLVYGVLAARAGTSAVLNKSDTNVVEMWNQRQIGPDGMIAAAGYYYPTDVARTLTWTVSDCYNSATAGVAIKRLNWN